MLVHHRPTKILIVGRSGSGKTTYLIRYVEHAPNYDTIFLFDHKGEFEHRIGIVPCNSIEECEEKLKKGEKHISYFYANDYPGDSAGAFQFYCDWAYAVTRARVESGFKGMSLFVCDEVNRFTGTSDLGYEFGQLIEDGRLWGLDFIGTSHAANQIHNRLRLQLSEIVALRTKDVRPLAFLEECGFDTEEVKNLPIGSYIAMDCDTDEFTRGKLFSCVQTEKDVSPDETESSTENIKTDHGTLPPSSTDRNAIHRHGGHREPDHVPHHP
jgi:GTPase SAR1 family protein